MAGDGGDWKPAVSGESANKGDWIMGLMEAYKKEPGGKQKLQERNPKWINDDYVKFIRFAEHMIEKNGEGVWAHHQPRLSRQPDISRHALALLKRSTRFGCLICMGTRTKARFPRRFS